MAELTSMEDNEMNIGIENLKIEGLKQFSSIEGLPQTDEEIKATLRSPMIKKSSLFRIRAGRDKYQPGLRAVD